MRKVLITGGSEGIGYALAECFAADGYHVILAARTKAKLEAAKEKLQAAYGCSVDVISVDLREPGCGRRLFDLAGRVDVLVNNAGIGYTGRAEENAARQEEMVNVNVRAVVSLCAVYLDDMKKAQKGTIVNIASTGAFQPGPYIACYYASKAFVSSYTEALHEEAKAYGVHVCCVYPGPTATAFYEKSGVQPSPFVHAAEEVAKAAYARMFAGKRVIIGIRDRLALFVPGPLRTAFIRRSKQKLL